MIRKKSHFQGKEPILEKFLQILRFRKVFPYVKKNSRVLDIGCGYKGALLSLLASDISEGVGIDVSVSKKKIANNVKLISQQNAKFPKNYFDLITCLAVVEHLKNSKIILTDAYKSLKKNGKLILTTPSPIAKPILKFMAFKLKIISEQEIKDHKKYYSKGELMNFLFSCGFKRKNCSVKNFLFGLNTIAVAKK